MQSKKNEILEIVRGNFSKEHCNDKKKKSLFNRINFPSTIDLYYSNQNSNELIYYILSSESINKNMQKDESAFESWIIIIKHWCPEIKIITLKWHHSSNDNINELHYQRFLYRVEKFKQAFGDWFNIDNSNQTCFNESKIQNNNNALYLNYPESDRNRTSQTLKTEDDFELEFCNKKNLLLNICGIEYLYRQLPVGLFKNSVSKKNRIFPGGKASIDLWGFSENFKTFFIFELKKPKNNPLGIISELLFYSYIIIDLVKGNFKFEEKKLLEDSKDKYHFSKIKLVTNIKSFFLISSIHSLIDFEVIKLLNTNKFNINFEIINYKIDLKSNTTKPEINIIK